MMIRGIVLKAQIPGRAAALATFIAAALGWPGMITWAADDAGALVKTYCSRCHNPEKHQADVDLAAMGACIAPQREPTTQHFESEEMLMTETRERPRDFGDGFNGYVLNRGQMTLYNSVAFPYDGFYRFAARIRSTRGAAGARLRLD